MLAWVWEMLERWGHHAVDSRVYIAPLDTVGDVIAGLAGASAAAWWWHRAARRSARPQPSPSYGKRPLMAKVFASNT